MSVYENQLLGAFIYMLGYAGARLDLPCMAVNLFQQTPLDQSFGDLVVGATSCVAFEFKRDADSIPDEIQKWSAAGRDAFLDSRQLCELGAKCHYLVFGTGAGTEPDLIACEYVGALDAVGVPEKTWRVESMLRPLLRDRDFGRPGREVQRYLEVVARLRRWGPDGPPGGGGGTGLLPRGPATPWLAVLRDSEGELRMRTAASLAQLLTRAERPADDEESGGFLTA